MILLHENAANHTRGGVITLAKTFNSTTLNNGAATQDVASFIPAGIVVLEGYLAIVDTILAGPTTWDVGGSTDTNRYGATLALAAGTVANPSTYAADWSPIGGAARTLRYTSNGGGNFTTGVVRSEIIVGSLSNLHA